MSLSKDLKAWGDKAREIEELQAQLAPWWAFHYGSEFTLWHTLIPLRVRFVYKHHHSLITKRPFINDVVLDSLDVLASIGEVIAQGHWSLRYLWPDANERVQAVAQSFASKSFKPWHPKGKIPKTRHGVFEVFGEHLIHVLEQMQGDGPGAYEGFGAKVYPVCLYTWQVPSDVLMTFHEEETSYKKRMSWHPYHDLKIQPEQWSFDYS